jgi:hypothetical protein
VSSQHHATAALSPGQQVPIVQEAGWAPEPAWTLWKREISLSLLIIEPRSLGHPVRSLGEVIKYAFQAIPTDLDVVILQQISCKLKIGPLFQFIGKRKKGKVTYPCNRPWGPLGL